MDDLFDRRLTYPDSAAKRRLGRLVGLDDIKSRLTKLLAVLVNPEGLRHWANKYHKDETHLVDAVERRPPLVILAGDVGSGKTELAETIGDAVARQEGIAVTLYPLSLATRGSGRVGEMTKLLSAAFDQTLNAAKALRQATGKARAGVILLVDEGDALTQSREASQMHHEDRAGVNAFIRGVDRLAEQRLPAAVILCTNRLGSIDPAVQRRAAEVFEFGRPDEAQRRAVLQPALEQANFTEKQIEHLAALSGPSKSRKYGFTFSDLTQRFVPMLVLDAYPDGPLTYQAALRILGELTPTPPFSPKDEHTK